MRTVVLGLVLGLLAVAGLALILQDWRHRPSLLEAAAEGDQLRLAVIRLGTGLVTGIAMVGCLRAVVG